MSDIEIIEGVNAMEDKICKEHGIHPDQETRAAMWHRHGGSQFFDSQGRIYWPVQRASPFMGEETTPEPISQPVEPRTTPDTKDRLDSLGADIGKLRSDVSKHVDSPYHTVSKKKDGAAF